MCGRYTYFGPLSILKESVQLGLFDDEPIENYNVAPTTKVPAILKEKGQIQLKHLHWGLIPFWSKDPKIASRLINARVETITEKPSFRTAFKKQRCLILSNGYYEWKGQKGNKQPYFITTTKEKPFGFAGLWDTWKDKAKGTTIQSCTIITTSACQQIEHLHHRMPIILNPEFHERWLDPALRDVDELLGILEVGKIEEFVFHPVSKAVNSTQNNGPELIEPITLR